MWFASLLTSGSATFGRLLMTVLIPNALPVFFLWTLLRAHSFTGNSDWSAVLPSTTASDAFAILLALVAIAVLAAILQPFQVRVVRLLEGYWSGWAPTARLAPVFIEFQRRRLHRLLERESELNEELEPGPPVRGLAEQAAALRDSVRRRSELDRVKQRILRYPEAPVEGIHDQDSGLDPDDWDRPNATPLLPTALGNALRTGEISAGERYRLNTIASWPRLYPQLSPKFAEVCDAARDAVDTAANLTVSFFLVAVLGVAGLYREPVNYWIPALALILMCLCYTGSIAAATRFNTCLHVAYDLHRFDMLKALHYKLPRTRKEESTTFEALSDFLLAPRETDREAHGLADANGDTPRYHHD
ncbi:hypothetical protein [Kutzneria chonburiensis]|uniref:Uncharacterized protein n=1 Tax=Kutzneria chonburiensis TaxID=1483604 RepID=A0ABV6MMC9_9PSEU|nr:hypothetical protein [Kutzneria chonburiensis]